MKLHKIDFSCVRGSNTIRGTLFRTGSEKAPIAVLCHGFLADGHSMEGYAQALAEEGYAAFTFDFVGGCVRGRSGGQLWDMTVWTEVEDLKAVLDYAFSRADTSPDGLLLLGGSQGGLVCALTAAQLGGRVERLIELYPALCIPDDSRRGQMLMFQFDPQNLPERIPGTVPGLALGREYPACMQGVDVFQAIRGYRGKVLLLHGTQDSIVKLDYSEKAHQVYLDEGADSRLVVISGGEHGFQGAHDLQAIQEIRAFARG